MTSPFALDHDFGASHGPLASKYYRTDDDIRIALNACLLEDLEGLNCPIAEETYGWLPYWDLVQVSDLSFLFRNVGNATLFRADVSQWRICIGFDIQYVQWGKSFLTTFCVRVSPRPS